MKNCKIRVNSIHDASEVCNICGEYEDDIDGACGKYLIDMKSILGIMSIGFGRHIDVYLHSDNKIFQDRLRDELRKWVVDE